MEACNDTPHGKLTEEVGELKEAIKHLEEKLVESNEALKDLQSNKVKDQPPPQKKNKKQKNNKKTTCYPSCILYPHCIAEFDETMWWQEKLESDIKVKKNSLLIDQQKCMSMRRTLPYNIVATRYF